MVATLSSAQPADDLGLLGNLTSCPAPEEKLGTSYVFVVDGSGSMNDNNRLASVKRSAQGLVSNMRTDDEVALYEFKSCNVHLLVPFTQDKKLFLEALRGIRASGGTSLASGITQGGNYLLKNALNLKKSLIVLTDGEESCGGSPEAAVAQFQEQLTLMTAKQSQSPDDTSDEDTPEIISISAVDINKQAIEELKQDKPFILEATFKDKHPEAWVSVEIEGHRNIIKIDGELGAAPTDPNKPSSHCAPTIREIREQSPTIVLYRSDDPKIFRSRPLAIQEEKQQ
jgi:hypothetical protein